MSIDFLLERFEQNAHHQAIIWHNRVYIYKDILELFQECQKVVASIEPGKVVAIEGDFSPGSVAVLLALMANDCIVVPLTQEAATQKGTFFTIAEVEYTVAVNKEDSFEVQKVSASVNNPLIISLRELGHPGLILFSSGSTGKPKGILHDWVPILKKYQAADRKAARILSFLLFDHIGGLNTLWHTLSSSGCIITTENRTPSKICATIEAHRVEVLPTSPTFINLLLISEAYREYDLSSLKLITYGTEVMPASTLERLVEVFSGVQIKQTYGLSEVGILPTRSQATDSTWFKMGGNGYRTRIRNSLLEIKTESSMLGYLNAPSPFTEDGWFQTGDAVEVQGEYLRILGRESELINVGGQKVYPSEVESVLLEMKGVKDAVVMGETNPILGHVVTARVTLEDHSERLESFKQRMHQFCKERLSNYKIPQKVRLVREGLHSDRFKRMRIK